MSFGWDSKSRWSLLSGVYARGSKRSHPFALEYVTVVDSTSHSNPLPPPEESLCGWKSCPALIKEEEDLSASTRRRVPARMMICQCVLSSAISVVVWFLVVSSVTSSCHLSFGLLRSRFPSTVICNIFLVASFLTRRRTCPNHLNIFSMTNSHGSLFKDYYARTIV